MVTRAPVASHRTHANPASNNEVDGEPSTRIEAKAEWISDKYIRPFPGAPKRDFSAMRHRGIRFC